MYADVPIIDGAHCGWALGLKLLHCVVNIYNNAAIPTVILLCGYILAHTRGLFLPERQTSTYPSSVRFFSLLSEVKTF